MTSSPSETPRSARRGPGRPAAVDAEAIARAVLDIGFTDLTFAAVASKLGISQATLYRHAANRDALVRLGLDLILRTTEWPGLDGDWLPLLERWAIASWRTWERYPGAVLEATRGVVPASIIGLTDRVGVTLVRCGFAPRDAVLAVDLVFDLVADSRRGVETYDGAPLEDGDPVRTGVERQWLNEEPTGDEATALIRSEMLSAIRTEPFEWFHRKLRLVLAGIARELAPGPAPSL